jgi:hypothetical protein
MDATMRRRKRARVRDVPPRFILALLMALTPLGACAAKNCPPNPNQIVGCGGPYDQIYNQIYAPGDPSWSQF